MANSEQEPQQQIIVKAASVIVCRGPSDRPPEILLVQRAKTLSFAGSATVFPGGKLHASDERLARGLAGAGGIDDAAMRIAGIREVIEETGLVAGIHQRVDPADAEAARAMLAGNEGLGPVLERFGWTLDLAELTPFAHWVPTFKSGRIFDTRFYLASIGTGAVALSADYSENTRLMWASARTALDMLESGGMRMIYPTRRNMERLAQFETYAELLQHAADTPMRTISPWIDRQADGDMLCIPADAGYPVTVAPLSQISLD